MFGRRDRTLIAAVGAFLIAAIRSVRAAGIRALRVRRTLHVQRIRADGNSDAQRDDTEGSDNHAERTRGHAEPDAQPKWHQKAGAVGGVFGGHRSEGEAGDKPSASDPNRLGRPTGRPRRHLRLGHRLPPNVVVVVPGSHAEGSRRAKLVPTMPQSERSARPWLSGRVPMCGQHGSWSRLTLWVDRSDEAGVTGDDPGSCEVLAGSAGRGESNACVLRQG